MAATRKNKRSQARKLSKKLDKNSVNETEKDFIIELIEMHVNKIENMYRLKIDELKSNLEKLEKNYFKQISEKIKARFNRDCILRDTDLSLVHSQAIIDIKINRLGKELREIMNKIRETESQKDNTLEEKNRFNYELVQLRSCINILRTGVSNEEYNNLKNFKNKIETLNKFGKKRQQRGNKRFEFKLPFFNFNNRNEPEIHSRSKYNDTLRILDGFIEKLSTLYNNSLLSNSMNFSRGLEDERNRMEEIAWYRRFLSERSKYNKPSLFQQRYPFTSRYNTCSTVHDEPLGTTNGMHSLRNSSLSDSESSLIVSDQASLEEIRCRLHENSLSKYRSANLPLQRPFSTEGSSSISRCRSFTVLLQPPMSMDHFSNVTPYRSLTELINHSSDHQLPGRTSSASSESLSLDEYPIKLPKQTCHNSITSEVHESTPHSSIISMDSHHEIEKSYFLHSTFNC